MAITFALVAAFPHRLVYTATRGAGGAVFVPIPNTGAASPDLLTDAPATTPLGSLLREAAANQAAARAILTEGVRARVTITPRQANPAAASSVWAVDANNSVGLLPTVEVAYSTNAAAGAAGDIADVEIEFLYNNHQWPPI